MGYIQKCKACGSEFFQSEYEEKLDLCHSCGEAKSKPRVLRKKLVRSPLFKKLALVK